MTHRPHAWLAISFLLLNAVYAAPAHAARSVNPALIRALQNELMRSMKGLGRDGQPAPYFISYYVTDAWQSRVSASSGVVHDSATWRTRRLDTEVRVGDYARDNTHRLPSDRQNGSSFVGTAALPLTDDVDAIRAVVWQETDEKYKSALERLIQIQTAQTVRVAEEDSSADFSREAPRRFAFAPAARVEDPARWAARVSAYSAMFGDYAEIIDASVSLTSEVSRTTLVTSEGTVVEDGGTRVRLAIVATTKADDGMDLQRSELFDARDVSGLPPDSTIRAAVLRVARDLRALRAAPVIEPYEGPAILSGRAAGVFFHEIFGHRIEGHRQKNEDEGQTFTKKIGQPVLPAFLSVTDDPTRDRYAGVPLNGFYRFDSEGTPAQRVPVVEDGVLRNFLMSRSPVAAFGASNGHGRKAAGYRAVGRQGNLIVEASRGVPDSTLRMLLRAECAKQGKPFGLLFSEISGGFTFTGRSSPQSFQVTPVMVYRVYADGRPDELVRGANLIGTPLVSFAKIIACSDRPEVFNGVCGAESGWVPVSAVAPSVLTTEIEIQKKQKSQDRPPILPAPVASDDERYGRQP